MDITQLILDDHAEQRRLFAIIEQIDPKDTDALTKVWSRLSAFLDVHAEAEERFFYPQLLKLGEGANDAEDGTVEAAQAVAKANATAAAGIRVGQAGGQGRGTVLGDTGQASMEQRVTYSGPSESGEEETSGASSRRASRSGANSGGNRAERRRSKKKRRH